MNSYYGHRRDEIRFFMNPEVQREMLDPLGIFKHSDYSQDFTDDWNLKSYYERLRQLTGKKNHRDMALSIAIRAHFDTWNYRFNGVSSRITF